MWLPFDQLVNYNFINCYIELQHGNLRCTLDTNLIKMLNHKGYPQTIKKHLFIPYWNFIPFPVFL